MPKILFVCHGNICRSPMAEFIMRDLVTKAGLETFFFIASAATSNEELGNPVYPQAKLKLAEHNIDCSGKTARQLVTEDYKNFDLLIGMDNSNIQNMYNFFHGDSLKKIKLLLDYTSNPGEIADPWYTRNFEQAWNDIENGCTHLLKKLQREIQK